MFANSRLFLAVCVCIPLLGCTELRLVRSNWVDNAIPLREQESGGLATVSIASTDGDADVQSSIDALVKTRRILLNNIANAQTVGFINADPLPRENGQHSLKPLGRQSASGAIVPLGKSIGRGVGLDGAISNHTQGGLIRTGQPLDIAIEGAGFFQLTDPNGGTYYTRNGQFTRNTDGQIVFSSASRSLLLEPVITIPPTATTISITNDGTVAYIEPPQTTPVTAGQIQLAIFTSPAGLRKLGHGLYGETASSGAATVLTPGQQGSGTLIRSTLESSNVNLEEQLRLLKRVDQQLKVLRAAH